MLKKNSSNTVSFKFSAGPEFEDGDVSERSGGGLKSRRKSKKLLTADELGLLIDCDDAGSPLNSPLNSPLSSFGSPRGSTDGSATPTIDDEFASYPLDCNADSDWMELAQGNEKTAQMLSITDKCLQYFSSRLDSYEITLPVKALTFQQKQQQINALLEQLSRLTNQERSTLQERFGLSTLAASWNKLSCSASGFSGSGLSGLSGSAHSIGLSGLAMPSGLSFSATKEKESTPKSSLPANNIVDEADLFTIPSHAVFSQEARSPTNTVEDDDADIDFDATYRRAMETSVLPENPDKKVQQSKKKSGEAEEEGVLCESDSSEAAAKEEMEAAEREKCELAEIKAELKEALKKLEVDNEALQQATTEKETKIAQDMAAVKEASEKDKETKQVYNALEIEVEKMCQDAEKAIKEAESASEDAKKLYCGLEKQRRILYNEVQELKGNLRVFCRMRPSKNQGDAAEAGEDQGEEPWIQVGQDETNVTVIDPNTDAMTTFDFDLILPATKGQTEVFDEVQPLVTSVLDGYNVCLFAYGQTGSGKTHTMEGPPHDRGVNFRAVSELFRVIAERTDEYEYTVKMSVLEIYNDQVFDIVSSRTKCCVRWGGDKVGVVVQPLDVRTVATPEEVDAVLQKAYEKRSVAGTDCNKHSSRSHCLVSVHVCGSNKESGQSVGGKLHLIDLAGSERVKLSGVEGDRLTEATHINSSLTHLKSVIQGLACKAAHVPFRNSSLTALLQDSLGGNCKCLMFANISPDAKDLPETIGTLKYASEARRVVIGKSIANVTHR